MFCSIARYVHSKKKIIKKIIPAAVLSAARGVINLINAIFRKIILFGDRLKPFIRAVRYRGFTVYYSGGTSIVETDGSPPVRFGGVYEAVESEAIVDELKKNNTPVFLDVGANIGLITLNILAAVPAARAFAFEPGVHQSSLFEKTIGANGLKDRITLYKEALGSERGEASFAVHAAGHASGNGFKDTGRAGKANFVTVPVQTLDNWWKTQGSPPVNVVKIDAEGAEFQILRGGTVFLSNCQPVVFIEVNPLNLKAYSNTAYDILDWLNAHNYNLTALSGTIIDSKNLDKFLEVSDNFVARPSVSRKILK